MSTEQKAKRFVKKLGSKLCEAEPLLSGDDLKGKFQLSVKQLPKGPLKTELKANYVKYFKKLWRIVKKSQEPKDSKKADHVASELPYNMYAIDGKRVALEKLKNSDQNKRQKLGQRLLVELDEDDEMRKEVLEILITKESEEDRSLKALQLESQLTLGTNNRSVLHLCMNNFIKKMCGEVTDALLSKNTNRCVQLKETILNFLRLVQFQNSMIPKGHDKPSFEDLMAAILSLYLDLNISLARGQNDVVAQAKSTLFTLMLCLKNSPQFVYDAILQVTDATTDDAQFLLPIMKRVLQSPPDPLTHLSYIKYITTVKTAKKWLNKSYKEEVQLLLQAARKVSATAGFMEWLHEKSPTVMDEIPLPTQVSGAKITKFLLKEASMEVMEELIDSTIEEVEIVVRLDTAKDEDDADRREVLFFVDKSADKSTEDVIQAEFSSQISDGEELHDRINTLIQDMESEPEVKIKDAGQVKPKMKKMKKEKIEKMETMVTQGMVEVIDLTNGVNDNKDTNAEMAMEEIKTSTKNTKKTKGKQMTETGESKTPKKKKKNKDGGSIIHTVVEQPGEVKENTHSKMDSAFVVEIEMEVEENKSDLEEQGKHFNSEEVECRDVVTENIEEVQEVKVEKSSKKTRKSKHLSTKETMSLLHLEDQDGKNEDNTNTDKSDDTLVIFGSEGDCKDQQSSDTTEKAKKRRKSKRKSEIQPKGDVEIESIPVIDGSDINKDEQREAPVLVESAKKTKKSKRKSVAKLTKDEIEDEIVVPDSSEVSKDELEVSDVSEKTKKTKKSKRKSEVKQTLEIPDEIVIPDSSEVSKDEQEVLDMSEKVKKSKKSKRKSLKSKSLPSDDGEVVIESEMPDAKDEDNMDTKDAMEVLGKSDDRNINQDNDVSLTDITPDEDAIDSKRGLTDIAAMETKETNQGSDDDQHPDVEVLGSDDSTQEEDNVKNIVRMSTRMQTRDTTSSSSEVTPKKKPKTTPKKKKIAEDNSAAELSSETSGSTGKSPKKISKMTPTKQKSVKDNSPDELSYETPGSTGTDDTPEEEGTATVGISEIHSPKEIGVEEQGDGLDTVGDQDGAPEKKTVGESDDSIDMVAETQSQEDVGKTSSQDESMLFKDNQHNGDTTEYFTSPAKEKNVLEADESAYTVSDEDSIVPDSHESSSAYDSEIIQKPRKQLQKVQSSKDGSQLSDVEDLQPDVAITSSDKPAGMETVTSPKSSPQKKRKPTEIHNSSEKKKSSSPKKICKNPIVLVECLKLEEKDAKQLTPVDIAQSTGEVEEISLDASPPSSTQVKDSPLKDVQDEKSDHDNEDEVTFRSISSSDVEFMVEEGLKELRDVVSPKQQTEVNGAKEQDTPISNVQQTDNDSKISTQLPDDSEEVKATSNLDDKNIVIREEKTELVSPSKGTKKIKTPQKSPRRKTESSDGGSPKTGTPAKKSPLRSIGTEDSGKDENGVHSTEASKGKSPAKKSKLSSPQVETDEGTRVVLDTEESAQYPIERDQYPSNVRRSTRIRGLDATSSVSEMSDVGFGTPTRSRRSRKSLPSTHESLLTPRRSARMLKKSLPHVYVSDSEDGSGSQGSTSTKVKSEVRSAKRRATIAESDETSDDAKRHSTRISKKLRSDV